MARKTCALLWDESFLWGLMAYRTLRSIGLPFELLRAEDIRAGALDDYRMLFVPGGWASNKLKALGGEGADAIRTFVENGGAYFGICGGAGLATDEGLALLPITRRPTRERVPSLSGPVALELPEAALWQFVGRRSHDRAVFHIWWPSQFVVSDGTADILARYAEILPEAYSADLNVGDVGEQGDWKALEDAYGINLDPRRMIGEPAVVSGNYGSGGVLLSLVHLDTPGDRNGAQALKNIWKQYAGWDGSLAEPAPAPREMSYAAEELFTTAYDLIAFGERNFLWYWRTPLLLQWRRGIRGLEYCTLYGLIEELRGQPGIGAEHLLPLKALLDPFAEKARLLLFRERMALQTGGLTYEKTDDPEIARLRQELFSATKSYGGTFKELLDKLDAVLMNQLRSA
jgi:putative intracellular protease/amidase